MAGVDVMAGCGCDGVWVGVQDSQSQRGLEAALAQIAHPEGPDLMANLTAETEAEGKEGSGSDLARKHSASDPALLSRLESIESSPLDPGLPPPIPRTPVRRQSRVSCWADVDLDVRNGS